MKKIVIIFALITIAISISIAFAEDNITRECDPDIIEGSFKTTTCWYYNNSKEKVIYPKLKYAGEMDVYEDILPGDDSFSHVSTTYLDPEGNPMVGPYGYAKVTIEYQLHEDGPVCRYWYLEPDPDNDVCGYTYRYFDADGEPVITKLGYGASKSGCAAYTMSMYWKDNEFVQKESYFGTDGKPILLEHEGYSSVEKIMSNSKNEIRYYGPDGKLMIGPEGYAYKIYNTDDGKPTRYYDAEEQQIPNEQIGPYTLPANYAPLKSRQRFRCLT